MSDTPAECPHRQRRSSCPVSRVAIRCCSLRGHRVASRGIGHLNLLRPGPLCLASSSSTPPHRRPPDQHIPGDVPWLCRNFFMADALFATRWRERLAPWRKSSQANDDHVCLVKFAGSALTRFCSANGVELERPAQIQTSGSASHDHATLHKAPPVGQRTLWLERGPYCHRG